MSLRHAQGELSRATPPDFYPGASRPFSQLWQLPLLLLSLIVFAAAGYLFWNASPGLTVRKRIDLARAYVAHERPEAAIEQLNRLLTGERLTQEHEAQVHLTLAEALETAQRQRKISIAANHTRIIEQTQIALQMGIKPTAEIYRRLGDSYQALARPADAVANFRTAMTLDPQRALRMRRKIIEVQSAAGPADAAASLDEYLSLTDLTDAERAWALGEKSQFLADRGEFVAARTMIADALRLDSDPIAQAQASYRMAYCAWKLARSDEAEKLARAARDGFKGGHPLDADAAYLLGRIRQEKNDLAQAQSLYQVVLTKYPESRVAPAARLGRAMCRIQSGQESAGLADMRELVDLLKVAPDVPVKQETTAALGQAGDFLAARSNYQLALEAMELERTLHPDPAAAYFLRFASAAQKRAEQIDQQSTETSVSDAERVRQNILVRELLTRAADADVAAARKLAAADAQNASAAFIKGLDLYEKTQNLPAAIAAMELHIGERPRDAMTPAIMLRLGEAYTSAGAPDKAIALYQQLQEQHPESPQATQSGLRMAQSLIAQGVSGYVDAEKTLLKLTGEKGLKPDSQEFCEASLELAKLHYRTERFDECVTRMKELIRQFPASRRIAEMQFVAADSLRRGAMKAQATLASATDSSSGNLTDAVASRKQRLTEAREMFDRVVALYHAAPPATADRSAQQYERLSYFYRADCVFELGGYGDAIKLYDQAAARYQQDPASLAAYVQIVNCYCAMGQMNEAKAANEKAKQLLRRMPPEAFNDGGFVMPKAYWEQWLKWTSTAGAW